MVTNSTVENGRSKAQIANRRKNGQLWPWPMPWPMPRPMPKRAIDFARVRKGSPVLLLRLAGPVSRIDKFCCCCVACTAVVPFRLLLSTGPTARHLTEQPSSIQAPYKLFPRSTMFPSVYKVPFSVYKVSTRLHPSKVPLGLVCMATMSSCSSLQQSVRCGLLRFPPKVMLKILCR